VSCLTSQAPLPPLSLRATESVETRLQNGAEASGRGMGPHGTCSPAEKHFRTSKVPCLNRRGAVTPSGSGTRGWRTQRSPALAIACQYAAAHPTLSIYPEGPVCVWSERLTLRPPSTVCAARLPARQDRPPRQALPANLGPF